MSSNNNNHRNGGKQRKSGGKGQRKFARGNKTSSTTGRDPSASSGETPTLVYSNSNVVKWVEHITTHSLRAYGRSATFFTTGEYPVFPFLVPNVDYGEEDVDPATDIGGANKDRIRRENAAAQDARTKLANDRISIYALMWGSMSIESREQARQHAVSLGLEVDFLARDDPLLLLRCVRATHLLTATGNQLLDRNRALGRYFSIRMLEQESLTQYKDRFLRAVEVLGQYGAPAPAEADQAIHFLQSLDSNRYGNCMATIVNNSTLPGQNAGAMPATVVAMFNAVSHFVMPTGRNGQLAGLQTNAVFAAQGQPSDGGRGGRGGGRGGGRPQSGRGRGEGDRRDNRNEANGGRGGGGSNATRTSEGSTSSARDDDGCWLCGEPEHMSRNCPYKSAFKEAIRDGTITPAGANGRGNRNQAANNLAAVVDRQQQGAEEPMPDLRFGVFMARAGGGNRLSRDANGAYAVVLDSGAAISIIKDADLLQDIRPADNPIDLTGIVTGPVIVCDRVGTLPGFGTVYYHPDVAVNALSQAEVEDRCRVSYHQGVKIDVHLPGGATVSFVRRGRHYVARMFAATSREDRVLVVTVEDREAKYTKSEVKAAQEALRLRVKLGYPSPKDFVSMLDKAVIRNTKVTVKDALRSFEIYGPTIAELMGKTKMRQAKAVSVEHVPRPIRSDLVMHADICFVEGEAYFVSITTPLYLTMITYLGASRTNSVVLQAIKTQLVIYRLEHFTVKALLVDGEGIFRKLETQLLEQGVRLDVTGAGEHVPRAEVTIRTIKERARTILFSLPYRLPLFLLKWLVSYAVMRINMVPRAQRNDHLSPFEAFRGRKIDAEKDLKVAFGDYAQVARPNSGPRNSVLVARTEAAIALLPSNNEQHSVKFFSLDTGSYITRSQYVIVAIPQHEVLRINAYAKDKFVPTNRELKVIVNGKEVDGAAQQQGPEEAITVAGRLANEPEPTKITGDGLGDAISSDPTAPAMEAVAEDPEELDPAPTTDAEAQRELERLHSPLDVAPTGESGPQESQPDAGVEDGADRALLVAHISVKRALKVYPDEAKASMQAELQQMLDKGVFRGMASGDLPPEKVKKVIPSFMFLREKTQPGSDKVKLKARLVAGGNWQDRDMYDSVSSPTAHLSSLFMVAGIAAKERRVVATLDVAGAYLNAPLTSEVYMRLDSYQSSLLVELDPSFKQFVHPKLGYIIVQLQKALYGCIESGLKWFEHISGFLRSLGFKPNPMDPCVFNLGEGDDQLTILLYVDDLLITCKLTPEIEWLMKMVEDEYGEITQHWGLLLPFLGMLLDFSVLGEVTITMKTYVEDTLRMARHTPKRVSTPATLYLFDHDPNSPLLDEDDKAHFHSVVAKIYYLAKRARPDVLTALSFLATRTSAPTLQDLGKLMRVMDYLYSTKEMGITLRPADGEIGIKAYIDAAYANHHDMKSHTGIVVTLGEGPFFVRSAKQTLVTKSSSEAELVALSDGVSYVLWSREFLIGQGYKEIKAATVYQDNQATITMAQRGPTATGKSRHVNVRYYFVKDRIATREIELQYKRTQEMISDVLTKPLQGSHFRKLRAALLNWRY